MKTVHVIALTLVAAGIAGIGPAFGQEDERARTAPGGMLRTMPHGSYQCALPGDAGGAAFEPVADEHFRIFTASRYETEGGAGTYILRGKNLTFTRGPKKGERFVRVGDNQLRKLSGDGTQSALLCTRLGTR